MVPEKIEEIWGAGRRENAFFLLFPLHRFFALRPNQLKAWTKESNQLLLYNILLFFTWGWKMVRATCTHGKHAGILCKRDGGSREEFQSDLKIVQKHTWKARPHKTGLPMKTARAPRANALRTSVPFRIPPSTKTSTLPSTALTISGSASS